MVELCPMNPLLPHPHGAYLLHQKVGAVDVYDLAIRAKVCSFLVDPVDYYGHGKLVTYGPKQDSVILVASKQVMEYSLSDGTQVQGWALPPSIDPASILSLYCHDQYLILHTYEDQRLFVHYCEFKGDSLELERTDPASQPISPPYIEWAPSGHMRFILAELELNILFWNNQARYWFSEVLPLVNSIESLWLWWNPKSNWCLFNAGYAPDPEKWPLQTACPPYEMQALALSVRATGVYTVKNPVNQLESAPSGLECFQLAMENFGGEFGMESFPPDVLNDIKDQCQYAMPVPQAGLLCFVSQDGKNLTVYDAQGENVSIT